MLPSVRARFPARSMARHMSTSLGRVGALRRSCLPASTTMQMQPSRNINIHEYQSMELFDKFGVPHPAGSMAASPEEAVKVAEGLPGPDFVVKAQVLSGGRGKGKFSPNGFQGGVHLVDSTAAAGEMAANMIGQNLVTKQSGAEGKPCHKVFVGERMHFVKETYFAILMDRATQGPVMVASPAGGMNIEEVAEETPELIFKEPVDMKVGPTDEAIQRLAVALGFETADTQAQAAATMRKLYELFAKSDCTLVEINPLSETREGEIVCADAKLNFDDNADYRQKEIFALRDTSQEDPREVEASGYGLNYIGLDGSIGCLVNGAGLAMATMDVIKLFGGSPANFLDMGGGANKTQVTQAFKLLNEDPAVKSILVNIFGGIMRCDTIAGGMVEAAAELNIKKPIIVRLEGTNVEQAVKLVEESGLSFITAKDLGDAAQKAVTLTNEA